MFTQFFGNYLLNQNLVTPEQLIDGLQAKNNTRMKLGVLAINAGYMTASQVEMVHMKQSTMDKRFGDIAIECGFVTSEQIDELLSQQPQGYLLLGQAFVDKGYMTNAEFEDAIRTYKEKYSLSDNDLNEGEDSKSDVMIDSLIDLSDMPNSGLYKQYIVLMMNNLIRFTGDDYTPLEPEFKIDSDSEVYITTQDITGEFNVKTGLIADEKTLIDFACRYAGEELTEMDEYVDAAACDFMNLHNGLFTVNVSNEHEIELKLTPPSTVKGVNSEDINDIIVLPVQYPFGIIKFLITK
ncbi:MAG: chemotaxis protein CheX [Lachnospiraceae bacterium]|nr:chemotaxis protein CheX [Lachnospiraceae bacterium]